jgi:hypothetical protein
MAVTCHCGKDRINLSTAECCSCADEKSNNFKEALELLKEIVNEPNYNRDSGEINLKLLEKINSFVLKHSGP